MTKSGSGRMSLKDSQLEHRDHPARWLLNTLLSLMRETGVRDFLIDSRSFGENDALSPEIIYI
jgi:hypothetical protein